MTGLPPTSYNQPSEISVLHVLAPLRKHEIAVQYPVQHPSQETNVSNSAWRTLESILEQGWR